MACPALPLGGFNAAMTGGPLALGGGRELEVDELLALEPDPPADFAAPPPFAPA
jgi:hypothetical protein